jgi:hypothetical protein
MLILHVERNRLFLNHDEVKIFFFLLAIQAEWLISAKYLISRCYKFLRRLSFYSFEVEAVFN